MLKITPTTLLSAAALALLAGCGGGSSSGVPVPVDPPPVTPPPVDPPPPVNPPPVNPPPVTPPPVDPPTGLPASFAYYQKCEKPRVSTAERYYPDQPGTLSDEKNWLRLWTDEVYLWYKEVPQLDAARYATAVDYFNVLKTSALTASGKAKDRYHFSYPSATWEDLSRGVELGYGASWARSAEAYPRYWRLIEAAPGSPAERAGLRRGDRLTGVDGEDFVNASAPAVVARLNAGLFPQKPGETHTLTVSRDGREFSVSVQAAKVSVAPVQGVRVLETAQGRVGYLSFTGHNEAAEAQLIDAVAQLKAAQIGDLVLDLRYNGGGLLQVASELAFMIAGPSSTQGKIFENTIPNDKTRGYAPLNFLQKAMGYAVPKPVAAGTPLPSLGLKRVFVLTGPGTCSASESIINGLRGVDIEVALIGERTCGKPYAFQPTPNCGTTYFTIQYQGVNNKGFGDYADGFAPTCRVADDMEHALGDPQEGMLAAALQYRASGACPAPRSARAQAAPLPALAPVRPQAAEISVYTPPR